MSIYPTIKLPKDKLLDLTNKSGWNWATQDQNVNTIELWKAPIAPITTDSCWTHTNKYTTIASVYSTHFPEIQEAFKNKPWKERIVEITVEDTNKPETISPIENLLGAANGDFGSDQQRIAQEVIKWGDLLLRKNRDYGSSVWKTPVLAPDCDPGVAIRVRMSDKVSRLSTLLTNGNPQVDESIEDTLRDLGSYCLLELARPKDES